MTLQKRSPAGCWSKHQTTGSLYFQFKGIISMKDLSRLWAAALNTRYFEATIKTCDHLYKTTAKISDGLRENLSPKVLHRFHYKVQLNEDMTKTWLIGVNYLRLAADVTSVWAWFGATAGVKLQAGTFCAVIHVFDGQSAGCPCYQSAPGDTQMGWDRDGRSRGSEVTLDHSQLTLAFRMAQDLPPNRHRQRLGVGQSRDVLVSWADGDRVVRSCRLMCVSFAPGEGGRGGLGILWISCICFERGLWGRWGGGFIVLTCPVNAA